MQAQQRCGFELNVVHAPRPWNYHEVCLTPRVSPCHVPFFSVASPLFPVPAPHSSRSSQCRAASWRHPLHTRRCRRNFDGQLQKEQPAQGAHVRGMQLLLLQLPLLLLMMTTFRLSLDWGDFVYFFWAYLWKSIEFLRVDRLFNEQGAFQVPLILLCIMLKPLTLLFAFTPCFIHIIPLLMIYPCSLSAPHSCRMARSSITLLRHGWGTNPYLSRALWQCWYVAIGGGGLFLA